MKIAITANTSWNLFNFRMSLIKAFQERGHEVVAIAPADEYTVKLVTEGVAFQSIRISSTSSNPVKNIRIIFNYYRLLKKIRPDIVLSYTIKPNLYVNYAAQLQRIPVISNVSGLGTLFIQKTITSRIGTLLYRIAFKRASWVFFQNSTDRDLFVEQKLVSPGRSGIIPGSGVDMFRFRINRTENKARIFLFVGRIIGDKGIREYIEAAKMMLKEYPDLEFRIIGESAYDNKTAITKQELNSWLTTAQIKYLGMTDNIFKELSEADVVVLPSYREGLSKSLIEAASMNLPIITTDVPGCREVVEHGASGFLCKTRDAADLAAKMRQMTGLTEQQRLMMGEKGRSIAGEKFDEKIIISKYLEKADEIVSLTNAKKKPG